MNKFIKINAFFVEKEGEEQQETVRPVIVNTDYILSIEPRNEDKYIIHTMVPVVYSEPRAFGEGKKQQIRNVDNVYQKFYIITKEEFETISL